MRAASMSLSLTPANSTYSKVMRRWWPSGKRRAAASRAAMFQRRLTGMSWSRTSSVVALSEMARLGSGRTLASRSMPVTTPEVDTVMRRGDRPAPQGCSMMESARVTCSRLCSGSPMPMKTILVGFCPTLSMAQYSCSTISPAVRLRPKPSVAVAQKAQPQAQPTWQEMHKVSLLRSCLSSGISTRLDGAAVVGAEAELARAVRTIRTSRRA